MTKREPPLSLYLFRLQVFSHIRQWVQEHTHEDEATCVGANGAVTMANSATDGVHDSLLILFHCNKVLKCLTGYEVFDIFFFYFILRIKRSDGHEVTIVGG